MRSFRRASARAEGGLSGPPLGTMALADYAQMAVRVRHWNTDVLGSPVDPRLGPSGDCRALVRCPSRLASKRLIVVRRDQEEVWLPTRGALAVNFRGPRSRPSPAKSCRAPSPGLLGFARHSMMGFE